MKLSLGNGILNPDRLFNSDPFLRKTARELYETVQDLPIVSPHGHTDPSWFTANKPFSDAASLFVVPDHYLFRMANSLGMPLDDLGIPRKDKTLAIDPRVIWKNFASIYEKMQGTPSSLWVDHAMSAILGCTERLTTKNADSLFDAIGEQLKKPEFLPRALLDKFAIETIATTEDALDRLEHHKELNKQGYQGRVRTNYRPDNVLDPDAPNFIDNLQKFGEMTGEDISNWDGMIEAHRKRRAEFIAAGATASDHGMPLPFTADLEKHEKQRLLDLALKGQLSGEEKELFRGQMLTEMAALSLEDGMVMQLHCGVRRNTDKKTFALRGPNMGADIPLSCQWVDGMAPLLNRYGNEKGLKIIMFSMDETTYTRELAPMAGYWSSLLIGPPWWFVDSPRGMRRYFDSVVETAGFENLAGFNDDTRALLSIPARHDVWRREVCNFLALLYSEHQISKDEAVRRAYDLSYRLAKKAYKL